MNSYKVFLSGQSGGFILIHADLWVVEGGDMVFGVSTENITFTICRIKVGMVSGVEEN